MLPLAVWGKKKREKHKTKEKEGRKNITWVTNYFISIFYSLQ